MGREIMNIEINDVKTMVSAVINEILSKQKNVLEEGKRDNQLLPYLELFNEKTGKNMSLGEFKTMMLRKLSTEGGMHNISLQSNYYLVGAVKYYFQGLLTTTPELGVYTDSLDDWNQKVCPKLNALILALRNGYIDSIGTTWMEPEDFGEMNLKDLFTKYSKEIKKVLSAAKKGGKSEVEPEAPKDYEMNNPNYTYDIIYSFADSSNYEHATSPGSWCITYGNNHLMHYTSRGNGHFVIFRQNGYELIPRKKEPEKWIGNKPQDDYGNSLIAFLQDNNSPGPANYNGGPLITSRWNHGYDGIYCEADRAYTFDEFKRITGVSNEDLAGIYNTWKKNVGVRSETKKVSKVRKVTPDEIRQLKYIQMRINGGEKPEGLIKVIPTENEGKYNIPSIAMAKINDTEIYFIFYNKRIFFETAVVGDLLRYCISYDNPSKTLAIFLNENINRHFIINKRTKDIINIEGQWLFKSVSNIDDTTEEERNGMFVEVKVTNKEIALIDYNTGIPLKLPNGHCWFNQICSSDVRYGSVSREHGEVVSVNRFCNGIYEITYDLSSGEKYFYNPRLKRFITFNTFGSKGDNKGWYIFPKILVKRAICMLYSPQGVPRTDFGYFYPGSVDNARQCIYNPDCTPGEIVFKVGGKKYKIGDNGPLDAKRISFDDLKEPTDNFYKERFLIVPIKLSMNQYAILYDFDKKAPFRTPTGEVLFITRSSFENTWNGRMYVYNDSVIVITIGNNESQYIYNLKADSYVTNPYDGSYFFKDVSLFYRDENIIQFTKNDAPDKYEGNVPSWWSDRPGYERYYLNYEKTWLRYYNYNTNVFYKDVRPEYNNKVRLSIDKMAAPVDNQEQQPSYSLTEQDIVHMVKDTVSRVMNEAFTKRDKEYLNKFNTEIWYWYSDHYNYINNPMLITNSLPYAKAHCCNNIISQVSIDYGNLDLMSAEEYSNYCNVDLNKTDSKTLNSYQKYLPDCDGVLFEEDGAEVILLFKTYRILYKAGMLYDKDKDKIRIRIRAKSNSLLILEAYYQFDYDESPVFGRLALTDIGLEDLKKRDVVSRFFYHDLMKKLNTNKPTYLISTMNVETFHRGYGFGTALLDYAVKNFNGNFVATLDSTGSSDDVMSADELMALFEKKGFEFLGQYGRKNVMLKIG